MLAYFPVSGLLTKTRSLAVPPTMKPATELATRISRALIAASTSGSWTPSLERVLHGIGCRDSLNPPLVAQVIDPCLLNHHSLALGFFNWSSQQPGFAHTSLTYQSILKSLYLSRQFNTIHAILNQLKAHKLALNSSTYRCIISSFIQGRKTQTAYLYFNEFKSHILDFGPELCNSLLALLGSDGYFDGALKVFDEMAKRGLAFSTIGLGVFLWSFCKDGDLVEVLRLLDEAKKSNSNFNGSVIAVLVVHGLCQASRLSEAVWVLNELRIRDCKPDFIAYRIVAEAFRSSGDAANVHKLLKMKRKLGVAPRSNDYREFILNLITERLIVEAKELGKVIVDGNFPLDFDVLNALIGSVSSTDPSSAMLFLSFMIGKERLPSLLTLNNLCRNLCRHGKVDEMLEVYHILSQKEYFSDIESYNVVFSSFCKVGRVREAYAILQEMKKKGLGPDISMYNSLMEACCKEDQIRPAKKLWDEMFVVGCGVNLKTYNIIIAKFSEIGQVEEALRLFNHMLDKGVAPDSTTYTSLLKGLCQDGKFDTAIEIFNKLVGQDLMLAQSMMSTFILNLCSAGQFLKASELLTSLAPDRKHSDSHVVLLKCLVDAEEIGIAVDHLQHMQAASPLLFEGICSELCALLTSSSKPESFSGFLQAMSDRSVLCKR